MKKKKINETVSVVWKYSIFGFFALILLSWVASYLLDRGNSLIATIESAATAITAAAVFGAGYFAYKELSEIENTRYMDIADRLFGELNSQENIEARRHIFQNLTGKPEDALEKLSAEDRDAMKKVLNSLDRVAFLTRDGWIPDDLILPWIHPMISKSWEKLGPYVLYERERRDEPYYYEHAGELAERCQKWREENLSEAARENKWIKVKNAL